MRIFRSLFGTKENRPQWEVDLMSGDWKSKPIFKTSAEFFDFFFPHPLMHNKAYEFTMVYNALLSEMKRIKTARKSKGNLSEENFRTEHNAFIEELKKNLRATDNNDPRIVMWTRLNFLLINTQPEMSEPRKPEVMKEIYDFFSDSSATLLNTQPEMKPTYRKAWEIHNPDVSFDIHASPTPQNRNNQPSPEKSYTAKPAQIPSLQEMLNRQQEEKSVAEVVQKIHDHGFESLTSRDFDFAQKTAQETHYEDMVHNAITHCATQSSGSHELWEMFLGELKDKEIELADLVNVCDEWKKQIDIAADNRLDFDLFIDTENDTLKDGENVTQPKYTLKKPEQFFDLLFHQHTPLQNDAEFANINLRDHRILFKSLVTTAKGEKNKRHDSFFQTTRIALANTFNRTKKGDFSEDDNGDISDERLKGIPKKPTESYASVYYAIFVDHENEKETNAIIEQLTKYDPTDDGYYAAREEFLRTYNPQTSLTKRSADTSTNHNELGTTTTITTNSVAPSDHKITTKMVLESLWGNINQTNPTADSACGKALAAWNEKPPHSPAIFLAAQFRFEKPKENDIKINDNGSNIEIKLTVTNPSMNKVNLNLSRLVDDKKNEETWVCKSDHDSIGERKQFELIAAESLALRKVQGVKDAEKIGIMDINDTGSKNPSTKFTCASASSVMLSAREEALIEAHFRAGYTEITYRSFQLTITPDNTHASTLSH